MSLRRGGYDKATTYFKIAMNILRRLMTIKTWQKPFTTWDWYVKSKKMVKMLYISFKRLQRYMDKLKMIMGEIEHIMLQNQLKKLVFFQCYFLIIKLGIKI